MYPPPLDRKPGVQTSKSWPGNKTVDDSLVTIKYMNHTIQFRKGTNLFQVPSQVSGDVQTPAVTEDVLKQALQIEAGSPRKRAQTVVQRSYSDNPENTRPRPKSAICVTVDVHPPPVPKRKDLAQGGGPKQRSYSTGVKSPDALEKHGRGHTEQVYPKMSVKQNCPVHGNQSRTNVDCEGEVPVYVRKARYYGYTEQQLEYWTQRHAKREGKMSRTLDRNVTSSDECFDQSSALVNSKIEQLKQEMRRAQVTQNSPRRVASDKSQQQSQEKLVLDQEQRALHRRKSTGAILKEGSDFAELDHLPDYTALEQQQYWTQRRQKQMAEKKKHFPDVLNKVNKEMQTTSKQTRECEPVENSNKTTGNLSNPVGPRYSVDDSSYIKDVHRKQQEKKDENDLFSQRRPRCKSTPCDGRIATTIDSDYVTMVKNDSTAPQQILYIKEREPLLKGLGGSNKEECKTGMSKWIYKGNSKTKEKSCGSSSETSSENNEPIYCEMKPYKDADFKHFNNYGTPPANDCIPVNSKSAVEYESMIKVIKKKSASVPRDAKLTNEQENKSLCDSFGTFDKSSDKGDFHEDYANIPEKTLQSVQSQYLDNRRKSTGTTLLKETQHSVLDETTGEKCNDHIDLPELSYRHFPDSEHITELHRVIADRATLPLNFPKRSVYDKYEICPKGIMKDGTFPSIPRSEGSIYEQYISSMNYANEINLSPKQNGGKPISYEHQSAFSYSDYENENDDDDDCGDESEDDNNVVWDDSEDSR